MPPSTADLRRVAVFQSATEDDLNLILQNSLTRSIEENSFFFLQGDSADFLYVLISGRVKLMQSNPSGQQVNLRTIYPWQMFGALGVSRDHAIYPASAQALTDSAGLAIGSSFLRSLVATRPQMSFELMNIMTSYVQEMQSRYLELATERVEQRVASALVRLAAQTGIKGVDPQLHQKAAIELAFSRQDIAEMTGSTLYTVSRLFSDWERRGILELGRERIRILNPHELVRIADHLET